MLAEPRTSDGQFSKTPSGRLSLREAFADVEQLAALVVFVPAARGRAALGAPLLKALMTSRELAIGTVRVMAPVVRAQSRRGPWSGPMQVFSPLKRVRSCAWAARGFCFVRSIDSLLWQLQHSSESFAFMRSHSRRQRSLTARLRRVRSKGGFAGPVRL